MKKAGTVILAIITLGTLILSILSQNAEVLGIKTEWLTIASAIILAIKQFYDQSGLFTAEEVAQFANYEKDNKVYQKGGAGNFVTSKDVQNWKSNK